MPPELATARSRPAHRVSPGLPPATTRGKVWHRLRCHTARSLASTVAPIRNSYRARGERLAPPVRAPGEMELLGVPVVPRGPAHSCIRHSPPAASLPHQTKPPPEI